MKAAGTHKGHCQACGAGQVVESTGLMAKHGYKVAGFGFFNGTCHGSNHQPLELERDFLDDTVAALGDWANRQQARANAYRNFQEVPSEAHKLTDWGQMVSTYVNRARVYTMVAWADATEKERAGEIERRVAALDSDVRQAKRHAKELLSLALRVHGQPLVERKKAKPPVAVGDQVRIWGSLVTITAIRNQVAHGIGPGINGQLVPHAVAIREKDGREIVYPTRLIRR
jgi:hypothetical protein